jgi:hypothetical protein
MVRHLKYTAIQATLTALLIFSVAPAVQAIPYDYQVVQQRLTDFGGVLTGSLRHDLETGHLDSYALTYTMPNLALTWTNPVTNMLVNDPTYALVKFEDTVMTPSDS